MKKDSAIPSGTPPRHAIAVDEDHSNMVKFGENDPICQVIMSFLSDLGRNVDSQRSAHSTPVYLPASQTLPLGTQDPDNDRVDSSQKRPKTFTTIPFSKDPEFVGREDILAQLESEFANPKSQNWASLYGLGGIGYGLNSYFSASFRAESIVLLGSRKLRSSTRIGKETRRVNSLPSGSMQVARRGSSSHMQRSLQKQKYRGLEKARSIYSSWCQCGSRMKAMAHGY